MPDYAVIFGDVKCYRCGGKVGDRMYVQWGELPARQLYQLGERVRWLDRKGERVPPFKLYRGCDTWNCGDPAVAHALVFEDASFGSGRFLVGHAIPCDHCSAPICGAAVEVEGGVFARFATFSDAEMAKILQGVSAETTIVVIDERGRYHPRPDWFDPPIESVDPERT